MAEKIKFCKQCGAPRIEGAKFCKKCGYQFGASVATTKPMQMGIFLFCYSPNISSYDHKDVLSL